MMYGFFTIIFENKTKKFPTCMEFNENGIISMSFY